MTEVVNFLAGHEGSSVVVSWMRPTSLDAETGMRVPHHAYLQRIH